MVDMPRRKRLLNRKTEDLLLKSLRWTFLAILAALLLDTAIILAVAFFPFGILNLPSQFISLLDYRLIVSLAVIELPTGVGIGIFLWRALGERTVNAIAQADAMMKYAHLKTAKRKKTKYVINTKTGKGYLMPLFVKKLAGEGIIQPMYPDGYIPFPTKDNFVEREGTIEEL